MVKSKQKKQLDRRKKFEKIRNERANSTLPKYRLDVYLNSTWCSAKFFRTDEKLQEYVEDTEALRKRGDTIIPGRVVELKTGKVVKFIEGTNSEEVGPSLEEAAKEKVSEKSEVGV